jgi:hypothetical protein
LNRRPCGGSEDISAHEAGLPAQASESLAPECRRTPAHQWIGLAVEGRKGFVEHWPQLDHFLDEFIRRIAHLHAAARDHFDIFGQRGQSFGAELK